MKIFKHLDFTIDFETCSLSANAAPMQVAVVPWLRDNDTDPLCKKEELEPYVGYVDLRTCVVDGYDFDRSTIRWWTERSCIAKNAVTEGCPEPVVDVLFGVLDYIRDAVKKYGLESVCLWCQGEDVDIAVLRNMCRKCDVDLEDVVPHTSFRDCRTVIIETALLMTGQSVMRSPAMAYDSFMPMPAALDGAAHDALYDAVRSTWYTWRALKWLEGRVNAEGGR